MGWRFRWVSSHGSDFNHDFGVSFTPERTASGDVGYNYGTTSSVGEDQHGASVFRRDDAGAVLHTYSTYARGTELLAGAFNWLDLTHKGRNETTIMDWVRLHDEYDFAEAPAACCSYH